MADDPASRGCLQRRAQGLNNSSLVTGRLDVEEGGGINARAFRYQYGQYELPQTEPGEQSEAFAVNDAGDIIGQVWQKSSSNWRLAVVWPKDGPRITYERGEPIGISSGRKAVVVQQIGSYDTGYVIDIVTGAKTMLSDSYLPAVFDNDRLLHTSGGANEIVERALDGQRVASYPGGRKAYGKTSSGTVFGATPHGVPTLWQWGTSYQVDSDKLPNQVYYGDVTDGGALIGTYETVDPELNVTSHPARWLWCT